MRSIFPDQMPGWIRPAIILLFAISWVPLATVAVERATPSKEPRVSLIPDMDKQEKFTAQAANPMFADGRAMRPPVPGTVAYGQARTDDWFYRGLQGETWATQFPMNPTTEMMNRGQRQYSIYCAPCHGHSGYGNGMVAVRADELQEGTWVAPTSLHDVTVRNRAHGHIFNTITNGIRNMPPYGPQISPEDRWAIVLYVRALQRSQNAGMTDVDDPSKRSELEAMRLSAQSATQAAATAPTTEAPAADTGTGPAMETEAQPGGDTPPPPHIEGEPEAQPEADTGAAQPGTTEGETH